MHWMSFETSRGEDGLIFSSVPIKLQGNEWVQWPTALLFLQWSSGCYHDVQVIWLQLANYYDVYDISKIFAFFVDWMSLSP